MEFSFIKVAVRYIQCIAYYTVLVEMMQIVFKEKSEPLCRATVNNVEFKYKLMGGDIGEIQLGSERGLYKYINHLCSS